MLKLLIINIIGDKIMLNSSQHVTSLYGRDFQDPIGNTLHEICKILTILFETFQVITSFLTKTKLYLLLVE